MTEPKTLLRDIFGFDEFRPGQSEIIEAVALKKMFLPSCRLVVENHYAFNCLH